MGETDKWDRRFLELAKLVSSWSKDPSTKVGAVIVNPETKIVMGLGYNGLPRGVPDIERFLENREYKYPMIVHAEANAILNASGSVKGCTIYVWPGIMKPNCCNECAKLIVQAGIKKVVAFRPKNKDSNKWKDQEKYSSLILNYGGVSYITLEDY